jgi:hypothetical protein
VLCEWFDHFISTTEPSRNSRAVLILDGRYSRMKNLEVINRARKSHVTALCLPPHSTHNLRPLYKTFMAALKHYYSEDVRTFLQEAGIP